MRQDLPMQNRPNILLITTDQQRYDCVGANGNPMIKTPALDQLAAEGASLEYFFANNPVCMPSRACFFTGRYCQNHGVRTNGIPLPETELTLAQVLREAGYRTGILGKLHFLPHSGRDHTKEHPSYGFHTVLVSDEPGCYPDPYIRWVREVAPEMEQAVRVPVPGVEPRGWARRWVFGAPEELSHTAWVAERTMEFIRENRDRPFFAVAGFYLPHSPWNPPQRWLELYPPKNMPLPKRCAGELDDKPDLFHALARPWREVSDDEWREMKAYYYACCSFVDHHVGRILDCLRELALLDRTLVVFVSDHGDLLGDHGLVAKNQTNYEEVVRVPCIFRLPEYIPAGRRVSDLVEGVDLMPTILDAVGVPVPDGVKGESQWAAICGTGPGTKEAVLIEHRVPHGRSVKTLRTKRWKYWRYSTGEEILVDLEADPSEFTNLAVDGDYEGKLCEMRELLLDVLLRVDDDLPPRIAPY